jgi:hypothetical protein
MQQKAESDKKKIRICQNCKSKMVDLVEIFGDGLIIEIGSGYESLDEYRTVRKSSFITQNQDNTDITNVQSVEYF